MLPCIPIQSNYSVDTHVATDNHWLKWPQWTATVCRKETHRVPSLDCNSTQKGDTSSTITGLQQYAERRHIGYHHWTATVHRMETHRVPSLDCNSMQKADTSSTITGLQQYAERRHIEYHHRMWDTHRRDVKWFGCEVHTDEMWNSLDMRHTQMRCEMHTQF
jgi:hypothetical protein